MTRRRGIKVKQISRVQGPQRNDRQPQVARVETNADLAQKYLGTGLVGMAPYLEVLSGSGADDLICKHGYDLYRRMMMDAEVDASLDSLVTASNASPLKVISPLHVDDADYELSQELVDFVTWSLNYLDLDEWRREQLRQALAFGNAVSEIDWDVSECTSKYPEHLYICRLRLQRPENYGFIVDTWGEIYGVAPLGQAAGTLYPMGNLIPLSASDPLKRLKGAVPRYKLAIWTWEQRETDPRGTSILIPAYIPWWSKQRAIEEWSCWLGRYAQPSLWATPGPDAVPICITNPDGSQIITQPTEALLQALLQFKSASVLALPFGSKVELLSVTGGATPFIESIAAFNKEITRAILGQHLATSEGATSGKNQAEIHALILRMLISSIRQFTANAILRDIIRPVVEANYGPVGHLMPTIDLGDGDGFPPTVTEIAVLFQSGYFSEDQLVQLDKILGLPVRMTNNRVGPGNLPQAINDSTSEPRGTAPAGTSASGRSPAPRVGPAQQEEET